MPFLVLSLVVIIALVVIANRQRARAADPIVVPAPNRPIPPRHQRVTDAELAERAATLRSAVEAGTIPFEDAVASLVRTCGVEPDVARARLEG